MNTQANIEVARPVYSYTVADFLRREGNTMLRRSIEAALKSGEIKKNALCIRSSGQASRARSTNCWRAWVSMGRPDNYTIYIGAKNRYKSEGTQNLLVAVN